ncbi:hypothetical protein K0504_00605 [Neiella marina]|uniref:Methyl-accepting chemotaxis protein n=1 Tax=Neiella holothuriorum TaxID=2870530 RepID=A0ABS7EC18_9GAMM|nr:hypothetical protein [Neiella holothuriorum]MBW8189518.1 hypothetical protein [Neiella holothuriorum]
MKITFSGVIAGMAIAFVCFVGASRIAVDSLVSGVGTSQVESLMKNIRHTLTLKQALDNQQLDQAHQIIVTDLARDLDELRGFRSYASDARKQEIDQAFVNLAHYRQSLTAGTNSAVARSSWQAQDIEALLGPIEQALKQQNERASQPD